MVRVTITPSSRTKLLELRKHRIIGGRFISNVNPKVGKKGILYETNDINAFIDSVEELGIGKVKFQRTNVEPNGVQNIRISI